MNDDLVYVNGIDGTSGRYLIEPMTNEAVKTLLRDRLINEEMRDAGRVARMKGVALREEPHYGLPPDVDPLRIEQAGWAMVFLADEPDATRAALQPLIEHRLAQVGAERHKVLTLESGQTWQGWLGRHKVAAGAIKPWCVPYYVLLVGDVDRVSFDFCHQLDVEYAVGLLSFPTADEYAQYARSVVEYETSPTVRRHKEAAFFAPRHDKATLLSADQLVVPLVKGETSEQPEPNVAPVGERNGFALRCVYGEDATKQKLHDLLCGADDKRPALFFTASHGVGWVAGSAEQVRAQGALLCQDWQGGGLQPDVYFTGDDVSDDCDVGGAFAFLFACFGAGTPRVDRFFFSLNEPMTELAPRAFVSPLPRRLLSHPKGGMLACIGHVERAWGCSIRTPAAGGQIDTFRNAINRLCAGEPVGHAIKDFNDRYASLSTGLASTLEQMKVGVKVEASVVARQWLERNDAGGYLILGDPAVRMRVGAMSAAGGGA